MGKSALDRFNEKYKIEESGCWEWHASKIKDGYGRVRFEGRLQLAHRVSYKLFIGYVEDELNICHNCDNKCCVSPFHLFKGTQGDNMLDARLKGRKPTAKCPSYRMYAKGCRCEKCLDFNRFYSNEHTKIWRSKNREKSLLAGRESDRKRSKTEKRKQWKRDYYHKMKILKPEQYKQTIENRSERRRSLKLQSKNVT